MIKSAHAPMTTPPARDALRITSISSLPPLHILDQKIAEITLVDNDK